MALPKWSTMTDESQMTVKKVGLGVGVSILVVWIALGFVKAILPLLFLGGAGYLGWRVLKKQWGVRSMISWCWLFLALSSSSPCNSFQRTFLPWTRPRSTIGRGLLSIWKSQGKWTAFSMNEPVPSHSGSSIQCRIVRWCYLRIFRWPLKNCATCSSAIAEQATTRSRKIQRWLQVQWGTWSTDRLDRLKFSWFFPWRRVVLPLL